MIWTLCKHILTPADYIYVEAIVICSITIEVMISINLTIVYFNWGSGITEVQSVTINKKQRT